MELVPQAVESYAAMFTTPETELLATIAAATKEHHTHAHMLSGHVQGGFLTIFSQLLQPVNILEIGTFTGYSALCLAAGLQENGVLHTIEIRAEDAATAEGYFKTSPLGKQIRLHKGNAREIIPTLANTWDLVFIDADKMGYIDYYELILPALRPNGVIIADNALFHGQVLESNISGKNALAIHAFNQHVHADPRVEQVLLTVRDGLLIIRKR